MSLVIVNLVNDNTNSSIIDVNVYYLNIFDQIHTEFIFLHCIDSVGLLPRRDDL